MSNVIDHTKLVETFIEVKLKNPDDFLKVSETLTRMGISSKHQKKLIQSCHILCKYKTRYFIVHFKQLFQLDSRPTDLTEVDIARVNTIANLLASWGLVELIDPKKSEKPVVPINQIKIIKHNEKHEWELVPKYSIGKIKK